MTPGPSSTSEIRCACGRALVRTDSGEHLTCPTGDGKLVPLRPLVERARADRRQYEDRLAAAQGAALDALPLAESLGRRGPWRISGHEGEWRWIRPASRAELPVGTNSGRRASPDVVLACLGNYRRSIAWFGRAEQEA